MQREFMYGKIKLVKPGLKALVVPSSLITVGWNDNEFTVATVWSGTAAEQTVNSDFF